MSGQWVREKLHIAPHSIRPETHWLYEIGHNDQPLWFSLQLSRGKAKELYEAFTPGGTQGDFRNLIKAGAKMAPASHAALCLALQAYPEMSRLGADILVPHKAFPALQKLECNSSCSGALRDFEITDAGLAIHHARDRARETPEDPSKDAWELSGTDALASPVRLVPACKQQDCSEDISRDRIIIAIIDDGVGIANRRFRRTDNHTRIKHFLDLRRPSGNECNPRPRNELLARSWTGKQIDTFLDKYPDDDEAVYRALDQIGRWDARQPLRASASHGTHMLDTAAGSEASSATVPDSRPILAVQVPTQIPETRSDTWLPQSLKRALDWILVKANELSVELAQDRKNATRLPLIVNCSMASMAGPKDGLSDLERRITQFVETYRSGGPDALCTVVLSAGNFLLTRTSARLSPPGTEKGEPLCWRIQPDDKTSSFVEIWGPPTEVNKQQTHVTLKPPRDLVGTSPSSCLGHVIDWQIDNAVYARLYHRIVKRPGNTWRECITIATRPTADEDSDEHIVPFGGWEIEVDARELERFHTTASKPKTGANPYIYLEIHRDDPGLYAHGKGRQSYFDDPLYERYDPDSGAVNSDETAQSASMVRLQGTVSSYAYARGVLVVGGYSHSDGTPISYSASGAEELPRPEWGWVGPDLAAVAEESGALWGILGTGTYSGSVIYLNGTSVAAPLAVRALADEIGRGGSVASFLKDISGPKGAGCGPQGPYKPTFQRRLRFGAGRLLFEPAYKKRIDP